jgi:hypothetical protein
MTSSNQKIAANRRNSRQSTGPKSPDGRARSRLNALRHGLNARQRTVPGEDVGELRDLEESLRAQIKPRGPLEEIYFDRCLENVWTLRRIQRAERTLLARASKPSPSETAIEPESRYLAYLGIPHVERSTPSNASAPASVVKTSTGGPKRTTKAEKRFALDRAVAEGFAPAAEGGQLSRLHIEKRRVERDFDRNLRTLLFLQKERSTVTVLPRLVADDDECIANSSDTAADASYTDYTKDGATTLDEPDSQQRAG